jgi:hypothetical protein
MSILDHEIEPVPSGEALLSPEEHFDLTEEEMDKSWAISMEGSTAINERMQQLQTILGHACMLDEVGRQKLRREIEVYRHASFVAEG